MSVKRRARLAVILLACLGAALLASCATSSGSALGTVMAGEGGTPPPEKPPAEPPASKQGLEIVSVPDRAEVWVDGNYKGLTPFIVDDITQGWHRLTLRKTGYYEVTTWLQFTSDYMLYQTSMVQITGFLQVEASPADSIVTVGSNTVIPGLMELPVGSYTLLARAFGYADYSESITISEKAVTNISITLNPAPFEVTSLSLPRPVVNPDNPGILGTIEAQFSVTGPGTGRIEVLNDQSSLVFSRDLPEFTTWGQSFTWNLRDASGAAVPDGGYRIVVTGQGSDGSEPSQREAALTVDRTVKVAPRSVWSGSSGLLYAPVAEVLPQGDFQASVLLAAISEGPVFRAPIMLGARAGMGSRIEIDVSGGIIPSSASIPFTLGAAARWNFLSPRGDFGLEAALEAKASFQYDSSPTAGSILTTDTFSDFTGLSFGVPLQLTLGPVSVLASVGLTMSLWYPYGPTSPAPFVWLYYRSGVLLDLGEVTAGISASARTKPLPGGFTALASPLPVQIGAEAHWLVPGTRILVSGMAAGEFDSTTSYYIMGGGGLGFLYRAPKARARGPLRTASGRARASAAVVPPGPPAGPAERAPRRGRRAGTCRRAPCGFSPPKARETPWRARYPAS